LPSSLSSYKYHEQQKEFLLMTTKFNYAVFIGRFSPVHLGHLKVMQEALEKADYLIVIVGSANQARNTRNPFTADERLDMIHIATGGDERILLASVEDHPYDEPRWLAEVQKVVDETIKRHKRGGPEYSNKGWTDYSSSIALAGMYKDETSYYLNSFPQWSNSIAIQPGSYEGEIMSATGIRNKIFNGELDYDKTLHPDVLRYIHQTIEEEVEQWDRLKNDWKLEANYEALWGKGPHVTVDSCVIQSGHILLIKRGREYGHGLWAMPGGFINRNEKIRNASVRELREETELKVPTKVLFGSIEAERVFDDPFRSNRSRIITHCFKYVLKNDHELPKVKGADDALEAKWVPISEIEKLKWEFFEDHYSMINKMLSL
jgi:bifunctional NMN adenylyltransferase/nudix hydrolase